MQFTAEYFLLFWLEKERDDELFGGDIKKQRAKIYENSENEYEKAEAKANSKSLTFHNWMLRSPA